jgi:hypothetical protein
MKPGRPRKADADRRTEVLHIRATKAETDAAYRLARRHDCTLTALLHAYLRRILRDDIDVSQKLARIRNGRTLSSDSLATIH